MDFVEWLSDELGKRGWSQNELARRMGISSGGLSMIVNQQRGRTAEFCRELARALRIPETIAFEQAGLLNPPRTAAEVTLRELYALLRDLPVEEQRAILDEARQRWQSVHGACTDCATNP